MFNIDNYSIHRWKGWRKESFERARRKTYVEPGKTIGVLALHKYFFTQEASDDFLLMVTVIPQFIKSYTGPKTPTGSYRYVIPRRMSQDPLENRYGDIKLLVGHNKLTPGHVVRAGNTLAVQNLQSESKRGNRNKRNCDQKDEEEEDKAQGGGDDDGSAESRVRAEEKAKKIKTKASADEVARFNPLFALRDRVEKRKSDWAETLTKCNFDRRMEMLLKDCSGTSNDL
jgi:hypothetical protein